MRILVGVALILALAAGAILYALQNDVSFSVTFSDAKQITEGDRVYLSGAPVGKVIKILPENGKVRIQVHIDRKFRNQVMTTSSFFIGQDDVTTGHMCLLIRNAASGSGSPLKQGDKAIGIDSHVVWSVTEAYQDLFRETKTILQDFTTALKQIDLDQVGADVRSSMDSLVKDMEIKLKGDGPKRFLYEQKNQIEHMQQKLSRMKDSEEARRLQNALADFHRRIQEEITEEKKNSYEKQ